MKKLLLLSSFIFAFLILKAQNFSREPTCRKDTFSVNYRNLKTWDSVHYRAVHCSQASDWGVRFDIAFNRFIYNKNTGSWLGNHNGGMIGLALLFRNLGMGIKFKPATISTKKALAFNGEVYPKDSSLNPGKMDIEFSYTFNMRNNFSIEPFAAITSNVFYVPEGLSQRFNFSSIQGFASGFSVNKYIHLKDFQFLAAFARFGYGFINFKKLNPELGKGYADISFGIAYKAFIKKHTIKKV